MVLEWMRRGFAPVAEVLSFIAGSAPILARCLTRHLTKCSREIGLAGKLECERDIDQGLLSSYQQRSGTVETLRADVLMRRLTGGSLERPREMEPAQARNRCHVIERKIALQVGLYIVQHAGQSASIKSLLPDTRESRSSRWADMVLNQSRRETSGQRFGEQPTGRSLGL